MRELSILLKTTDYRGDHSAEVLIPLKVLVGETVEALVERSNLTKAGAGDVIEIRVVRGEK